MDTMSPKLVWPRVILGYVIAPLIIPLAYYSVAALRERHPSASEFVGTLLTYGPYVYLFALILGVPSVLLLIRQRAGISWYAVTAGAIGLIGSGLMSAIGMKFEGVIVGTLAGALAGAVFCLVAGLSS